MQNKWSLFLTQRVVERPPILTLLLDHLTAASLHRTADVCFDLCFLCADDRTQIFKDASTSIWHICVSTVHTSLTLNEVVVLGRAAARWKQLAAGEEDKIYCILYTWKQRALHWNIASSTGNRCGIMKFVSMRKIFPSCADLKSSRSIALEYCRFKNLT
jgi:hypothetical protein